MTASTLNLEAYRAFLAAKRVAAEPRGIGIIAPEVIHPRAKPHQRAIIRRALYYGQHAIFSAFGLGKTLMQLEWMRLTLKGATSGRPLDGIPSGLIIAPLGVRQEFLREAEILGTPLHFIRTTDELQYLPPELFLTNYESVREGKIDVTRFDAVALDEAAILRGFGGTKTFREFMRQFASTRFKLVATATPSPNEYVELLAYADFLGVMDTGEGKTRFFKRNSEKADELTLYPHKEAEFWAWVHSWAVFLQRPSDLGFSDEGYDLPPLRVGWHTVASDTPLMTTDRRGQAELVSDQALGVVTASRIKRASLPARVARVMELVRATVADDQVVIWVDLNDEQRAIERALAAEGITVSSLFGDQTLEDRERLLTAWRAGETRVLLTKPVMYGAGVNLQQSHTAIFAGVGFKFAEFIQSVHRQHRFLQAHPVTVHIVYAEGEAAVRRTLEAKWQRHEQQMARMQALIREHGLDDIAVHETLTRTIGVDRLEASGAGWIAVHNDTVEETAGMAADSQGLILTSIPFGTQYEYSPSYNDFGHTDDDAHFWRQMDFLSPELYRVLMPGRVMCVHVKDRVRPGGMDGLGFQTVSPFHAHAILHYQRHGFAYMGMITVATDVVRENSQTYRLGWSEQCKDGSKMGVGMPEYVLLFRKPPSDNADGYADVRVVKDKRDYSRARWQFDAHGFWRSSGDRLLAPEELVGLPADQVFKLFRRHSESTVYDHEVDVALAESLERRGKLPPGFMLLQPQSPMAEVWTDVARMRTLNGRQQQRGQEQHLCPLQFDIVDRLIRRYSNPGEWVFDPFAGVFTVPRQAILMGRRGRGHELNPTYFEDGCFYLREAEGKRQAPTMFDLVDLLESGAGAVDPAEPEAVHG